jgi:SSS family solute:Na+ symporter
MVGNRIECNGNSGKCYYFFISSGQAYDDGLRFIQFYFGLPLAMIVIAVFFIPMYYKLKVYTAYEFLEQRFDVKTRTFTALLFLIQRAFSTGITIYAPSIILSQLLGWDLNTTVIFIGGIVTLYILSGGTKAVAVTHKQQMFVIYVGMFTAFGCLIYYLSEYVSFNESLNVAGALGKMNIITTGAESGSFDWSDRYNIISGLIGGLFLQLSYFGTDQSQVGRYLGGESVKESRLGLIFNGLMKVPVQFFILLTGVLVFVFYQFNQPPVYFNEVAYSQTKNSHIC